jgi:hypothetical protein
MYIDMWESIDQMLGAANCNPLACYAVSLTSIPFAARPGYTKSLIEHGIQGYDQGLAGRV